MKMKINNCCEHCKFHRYLGNGKWFCIKHDDMRPKDIIFNELGNYDDLEVKVECKSWRGDKWFDDYRGSW